MRDFVIVPAFRCLSDETLIFVILRRTPTKDLSANKESAVMFTEILRLRLRMTTGRCARFRYRPAFRRHPEDTLLLVILRRTPTKDLSQNKESTDMFTEILRLRLRMTTGKCVKLLRRYAAQNNGVGGCPGFALSSAVILLKMLLFYGIIF